MKAKQLIDMLRGLEGSDLKDCGITNEICEALDAKTVVHCKDCKHRRIINGKCPMLQTEWYWSRDYEEYDSGLHDATEDDNFCKYGEKK